MPPRPSRPSQAGGTDTPPPRAARRYTLPKQERLCRERAITALYAQRQGLFVFPVKATYRLVARGEGMPAVQLLVVAPKRRLRRSVDRQRTKRQLREAYRLQKHALGECIPAHATLHLALQWVAEELLPSPRIHAAVAKVLAQLSARVPKLAISEEPAKPPKPTPQPASLPHPDARGPA